MLSAANYLEGASVTTVWVQKREQFITDVLAELTTLETFKQACESDLSTLADLSAALQATMN